MPPAMNTSKQFAPPPCLTADRPSTRHFSGEAWRSGISRASPGEIGGWLKDIDEDLSALGAST